MRSFLATALLGAVGVLSGRVVVPRASDASQADLPSLLDVDLETLVTGLEGGAFTSVDLVNAYSARIMEVNSTLHMVSLPVHMAVQDGPDG